MVPSGLMHACRRQNTGWQRHSAPVQAAPVPAGVHTFQRIRTSLALVRVASIGSSVHAKAGVHYVVLCFKQNRLCVQRFCWHSCSVPLCALLVTKVG